jgi:hypothetical protein
MQTIVEQCLYGKDVPVAVGRGCTNRSIDPYHVQSSRCCSLANLGPAQKYFLVKTVNSTHMLAVSSGKSDFCQNGTHHQMDFLARSYCCAAPWCGENPREYVFVQFRGGSAAVRSRTETGFGARHRLGPIQRAAERFVRSVKEESTGRIVFFGKLSANPQRSPTSQGVTLV